MQMRARSRGCKHAIGAKLFAAFYAVNVGFIRRIRDGRGQASDLTLKL
jgi:hypothetical protein